MAWLTLTRHHHVVRPPRRWRRIGVALLMGLALTLAACGTSTGGGGAPPTPTPTPTPSPTPVPCTSCRLIPSPTNTTYPNSSLSAVSALPPSAAWAVGGTFTQGQTTNQGEILIEQWDGSAWQIMASVTISHGGLSSIAAISPRDIWAVGAQSQPGRPLIMHWDGTTWSVVPSPYPTGAWSAWLSDVAAITSQDVWAFGGQFAAPPDQQPSQLLVEHWDGASWQIVSSPPLPPSPSRTSGGSLSATRIPGTKQLWAVGEWHEWVSMGRGQPLIERWDGTAWHIVSSPALPTGALLGGWAGVVALSATNAWAVGSFEVKNPMDDHPLIAHWDGTRWQNVVTNPDVYGGLDSVAAAGANDVRAAGTLMTGPGASNGNGHAVPLIEQWNGTTWQMATTPELPRGALFQGLHIASDGSGNYWAVGSYLNAVGGQYQTLPLTLHCP
ncbi:MAG TPA: hypothetical protein VGS80_17765 [Ktedonobacterales bacterium]|nr:hypothetical protein [Ktedonobacterales bacterium]